MFAASVVLALGTIVPVDSRGQGQAAGSSKDQPILEGKVIDDQVVDERAKAIAGATVVGIYSQPISSNRFSLEPVKTGKDGSFKLPREKAPLILEAKTPDGRQIGIARVEAEQQEVIIRVTPTASVTGRLVDRGGSPVTIGYVQSGIRIPENNPTGGFTRFSYGAATFDSDGRFTLTGLVPGELYQLDYTPRAEFGRGVMTTVASIRPGAAQQLNLGDVVYSGRVALPSPARLTGEELTRALQHQEQICDHFGHCADETEFDFAVCRAPADNDVDNTLPEIFGPVLCGVPGVDVHTHHAFEQVLLDYVDFKGRASMACSSAVCFRVRRCSTASRYSRDPITWCGVLMGRR